MNQASIIIPTYKRADLLAQVFESLIFQDNIFEILVIDSNSNDGTKNLVESYNENSIINIKHIDVDNNVSLKRNTGIEKSLTNNLIFLDDDCIPDDYFVKNHLDALSNNPDDLNCGDVFFPEELVLTSNYIRYKNSRHVSYRYKGLNDKVLDYTSIVTMNMSMKKDDIIKNNLLFNEDFIGYGMEDNEFGFQIMNAGLIINTCPASIEHMEQNDPFLFTSKIYHTARDGVYRFKILNKNAALSLRYSYYFERDYPYKNLATAYFVKFLRLFFVVPIAKKILRILYYFDSYKALYFPFLYKYIFACYYNSGVKNRALAYSSVDEVSKSWYLDKK